MGNLTVARIKTLTEPGRCIDGDGLMLRVAPAAPSNGYSERVSMGSAATWVSVR